MILQKLKASWLQVGEAYAKTRQSLMTPLLTSSKVGGSTSSRSGDQMMQGTGVLAA